MSGNRCAFPDCDVDLVQASNAGGFVVGEEAHIVAHSIDGPRGNSPLDSEQRDELSNLILLCPTHHSAVDSAPEQYPIEVLRRIKDDHEARIRSLVGFAGPDPVTLRYANILQGWVDRTVNGPWWHHLTRGLFSARSEISRAALTDATDSSAWLLGRPLPGSIVEVERELKSFQEVLDDLLLVTTRSLDLHPHNDSLVWHEPFYKHGRTREESDGLFAEYDWIGQLRCDLALELARSANAVISSVTAYFDPLWRLEDGLVLIAVVDPIVGQTRFRPLYAGPTERYEGVPRFFLERSKRDIAIGSGRNESAERRIGLL